MRSLRFSKCSKPEVELTFTTQSLDGLFCFRLEIPFLGKRDRKTKNYQFRLKFCTKTNSNMQNSMVIFTFSVSTGNTFLGKFGPKNENCQFKRKFGTKTNLNMQNSLMMFSFQFLTGNTFAVKFGPKNQNCQFELKFRTRLI